MLWTMIILFSTGWKMAGMKKLIIIFVIKFLVAMITEEDVNHGGNNYSNYDISNKFNCAPADCRHYISASCLLCFIYRKPLKIFIFTLYLKHHSEDLFSIIFTSSIKFAWELFSIFPVSISSHHKRNWRQFTGA